MYPYLQQLHEHIVGPGKLVRHLTHVPGKGFHAVYAGGFAPRCIAGQSNESGGWGADSDPQLAEIKAIVEAVERYALGEYTEASFESWRKGMPTLTPRQLGVPKIAPELTWQQLQEVNTPEYIYAPLDFLHHPVDYTTLGRMPAAPLNISGVAAHQSVDAAITNGLLELCEHEALMVTWFGKKQTPTIRQESLSEEVKGYISILKSFGWQLILKDISLDLVPVVMAVGLGPKGKRALSIGACAAFSLRYATKKAVSEVLRTALVDEAMPPDFIAVAREDVHDTAAHAQYYALHKNTEAISWLWEGSGSVDATDLLTDGSKRTLSKAQADWEKGDAITEERAYVGNLLKGNGVDAFYREVTPKEVRESGIPLFVVRTLAPEMARLTVGHGRMPAQTDRFSQFVDSKMINRELHPFS